MGLWSKSEPATRGRLPSSVRGSRVGNCGVLGSADELADAIAHEGTK